MLSLWYLEMDEANFAAMRFRDLTIIQGLSWAGDNEYYLVLACDSFGGIGTKERDFIKMDARELGRKIIRVPLMELFAVGAKPLMIVDTLGVEMEPTGINIIAGIREELQRLGMDPDKCLNGSTEDNIPTVQTSAGVMAIGYISKKHFLSREILPGDIAVCVGKPKSGPEDRIDLDDPEIVGYEDIFSLQKSGLARDIVPVGSHGIEYELQQMAETRGRRVEVRDIYLDLKKSAGIATCIIAAAEYQNIGKIQELLRAPITILGVFV